MAKKKAGKGGIRLATDREGKTLFVWADDCAINPLAMMWEGMEWHYFGGDDGPWVKVEDAAAWHEKEGNRDVAEAMRVCIARFAAGGEDVVIRDA